MKLNLKFAKEEIKNHYRKEFFVWILSVLVLGSSLFVFVKELKYFFTLRKSLDQIEQSYVRIQPEIARLKRLLNTIDWNREYRKESFNITMKVRIRDLRNSYRVLKSLAGNNDDIFFLLQEMSYIQEKNNKSGTAKNGEEFEEAFFQVKGEKIIYR